MEHVETIRGTRAIKVTTFAALMIGLMPLAAPAATVTLTGLPGSNQMSYSFEYLSPNSTTPSSTGNDYNLAVPGIYLFNNSFGNQSALPPLATSKIGPYTFQDSYRFSVTAGASGDSLVASLGLGNLVAMSNLQFRLYKVTSANPNPVVPGIPPGATFVTPWVGQTGVDSASTVITKSFSGLMQGTYILDVAGIPSGSFGGSYIGSLNLQPVPLPSATWLLLGGLGGIGVFARKRVIA